MVAVLALLLLMVAFRSLVIPLISIGLNLLSVGAAYGLITLIFQDGHLQGPLGFTSFGGIIPWVPLFMFVFLFGLSMDYHVFILSRIRELRARGAAPEEAVVGGVAACSGVVTSAAIIMVAVFSIFATLSLIELKMIGVGLGVGGADRRHNRARHPGARRAGSAGRAQLVLPALAGVAAGLAARALRPGAAGQRACGPARASRQPPARREPEVPLAGERTGSREGAA